MALVTCRQFNPNPTAPLTQALQSFENILAEEQKKQYRNTSTKPDASSVIRFVAQIDANSKGRGSRCVAPRLCTFLDATQQFVGVVDTFVSSNPTVAALLWGSVKTTILAVSNVASYFDKVTSMIMKLGRSCPTFEQFGLLYPDCVGLQSALCDYYTIIIQLCVKILEVSRRTGVTQMLSSIFNPFESEFKSYNDDLDLAAKDVQLQISLASKQADRETAKLLEDDRKENAGHWRSALKFQKAAENEFAEQQQCRLRKAGRDSGKMKSEIRANLSTIDQVKPWKQAIQQRAPDTASWFQNDTTFRDWEHDKHTALLWVSGTLGVGKTVLVSNIVAHLHTIRNRLYIISYFFCRWDREESLQARNILGSVRKSQSVIVEEALDYYCLST
jgi:Skp family chaperone for outer membrane proteins